MTQEEIITKAVLEALKEQGGPKGQIAVKGAVAAGKKNTITLEVAERLIKKIEEKARQWDMRIVAAVSNADGRPVAVHCMDGAYHGSFDVALNKCYTSTAFQMPTAALAKLCRPDGELYGLQFSNDGKVMILGGGVPLYIDGKMVGALGVSGGTAAKDTELAEYGEKIFETCI